MHILETIERWEIEVSDLDARQPSEWADLDLALNESQYSYIRLGLLLEKIRNKSYWKYAAGKFDSFKQWCEKRLQLTVWQANSYIEAARIAIYLANAGYQKIPTNYSQANALLPAYQGEIGYYQERPALERVWEAACQLPKLTANAIKGIINPDAIEKESVRLPKDIQAQAIEQARRKGISLGEYLKELVQQDAYQDEVIDRQSEIITEPDPELGKVIDRLERKWEKVNLVDRSVYMFDRMMNNLIGNYIPRVQLE